MAIIDPKMEGFSNHTSARPLELNSCGKQYLSDRDYEMLRKDGRVDYHILYIAAGRCYIEENEEKRAVEAGNLIVFYPYERQYYSFRKGEGSVSCYIHFSGVACEQLLKKYGLYGLRCIPVGQSSRLEWLFEEMEEEYLLKRAYYEDVCAGLLTEFLSLSARLYAQTRSVRSVIPEKNMVQVCRYMASHYRENRPLEFFAEMTHLSTGRFAHAFKEYIGVSPKQYWIMLKLSAARSLISSTSLSMKDIAEAVGFDDVTYFSRLMKRHTGHPPKYYRK